MNKIEVKPQMPLFPVPVVMVTVGDGERMDIVTLAWVGMVNSEPPLVSISIRPDRYSHEILTQTGDFVINIPSEGQLRAVDHCGTVSGRALDKFSAADLTPVPASIVKAPRIHECPVNIECKVVAQHELGTHTMFIGEMQTVHIDKNIVDDNNRIDYSRAKPICYCPIEYWSLKERIGTHGYSKKGSV